jgi:hypothetical protein
VSRSSLQFITLPLSPSSLPPLFPNRGPFEACAPRLSYLDIGTEHGMIVLRLMTM